MRNEEKEGKSEGGRRERVGKSVGWVNLEVNRPPEVKLSHVTLQRKDVIKPHYS